MFDYTHRLQLALKDTARRSVAKLVAGIVILFGACFLISALWYWLAYELHWGAAMASLCIGVGLNLIGVILLLVSGRTRHAMPTTHELKREVDARVSLAADAASARARAEVQNAIDHAESKVFSLIGGVRGKKRKIEGKVSRTHQKFVAASSSNNGSLVKLLGAFAVGIVLARSLRGDDDSLE